MSSSIENRIVGMKFDNTTFQQAALATLSTMEKLKASLNFKDAATAISGLPVGPISNLHSGLSGLLHPIQSLNQGFSALGVVAVTTLATVTHSAVTAGANLAKSLTLDPIIGGYKEYVTNLNSIQTILANTQQSGATLDDVNDALRQLNEYSDQTIYNFSQMAENIGRFTANGVGLQKSVDSIKGISNLAALSGSSAQQASNAMLQLSQAIGEGRVSLMTWNSVVNAGMGGTAFQRALANTAVAMGRLKDNAVDLVGPMKNVKINGSSFRNALMAKPGEELWLDDKVLVATLQQFTGDLKDSELAAMGFSKAMIEDIQTQAQLAKEAATKVKSISQLFDVAKETAGSGWAQTWQLIFGDFEEARTTFTSASIAVNDFINNISDARNKMLTEWKDAGGRDDLIKGVQNLFKALGAVLGPIHDAFRDIFPATTGAELAKITKTFKQFTHGLIISDKTAEGIHDTFAGLFAVIGIGIRVIKNILRYIFSFFGLVSEGGGSIFVLTGAIGDIIVAIDNWIKRGAYIRRFFNMLIDARAAVFGPLIAVLAKVIEAFAALIRNGPEMFFQKLGRAGELFGNALEIIRERVTSVFDAAGNAVNGFLNRLGVLGSIIKTVGAVIGGTLVFVAGLFSDAAQAVWDFLNFGGQGAGDAATTGTKKAVEEVGESLNDVASLAGRVKDVFGRIFDWFKDFGGFLGGTLFEGFGNGFSEALHIIGGKFLDFIKDLGLRDILALVNTGFLIMFYGVAKRLAVKIGNVADSASDALDQVKSNLKSMQTEVRANVILKIAGAVALLAASLFVLSKIDPVRLATGLGAIGVLMLMMSKAMGALDFDKDMKIRDMFARAHAMTIQATAMVAVATAISILAVAVALFGNMDVATLAKGLGSVALVMGAMVAMTVAMSRSGGGATMIASAIAMTILAVALTALAGAVQLYDAIDASTLADGLISIALTLGVLVFSMNAMPRAGMIRAAASLLILSGALTVMAGALKLIASLSLGDSIQAVATLGATLLILITAMEAMEFAMPGAAALWVVSKGLLALAIAMKILGSMSLMEVVIALGALTGVLVILGVAGYVLAPVVPVIAALGGALLLLGAGMFLAGAGMTLFAGGLAILAASGAAGFAVITAGAIALLELLPLMVEQFGLTLLAIADVVNETAEPLGEALTKFLEEMFEAIAEAAPEFGEALVALIIAGLKLIRDVVPDLIDTALFIVEELARQLRDHTEALTNAMIDIFIVALKAIRGRDDELMNEMAQTIISLGQALAQTIRDNSEQFRQVGWEIADAILDGFVGFDLGGAIKNKAADLLGRGSSGIIGNSPIDQGAYVGSGAGARGPAHQGTPDSDQNNPPNLHDRQRALADSQKLLSNYREISDISPTITPVIDLSQVEKDASQISAILSADTSYSAALAVADEREASLKISPEEKSPKTDGPLFVQNINAPKSPSAVEVYRGTKNLVTLAKEALKL